MNRKKNVFEILLAVLAAALYALSTPFSKLLLQYVPSTLMAGLLYIGAGIGMGAIALFRKMRGRPVNEVKITGKEWKYAAAMIVLDIAAPICLLAGLSMTNAENVSLMNNFEIVATALIALLVFGETVSPRLWMGIVFVTASCMLLCVEDVSAWRFSIGSLFVLLACVCWGIENNCTRKLSDKDPLKIVLLKGIFSGTGSLVIGFVLGERIGALFCIPVVLALGFVAYGLSIYFYVYAQRVLGAARTSAYYAVAPFIGTALSIVIFKNPLDAHYFAALALMVVGAWLSASDDPISFRRIRKK